MQLVAFNKTSVVGLDWNDVKAVVKATPRPWAFAFAPTPSRAGEARLHFPCDVLCRPIAAFAVQYGCAIHPLCGGTALQNILNALGQDVFAVRNRVHRGTAHIISCPSLEKSLQGKDVRLGIHPRMDGSFGWQ